MLAMTERETVELLEASLLCFVCPTNYDVTKPDIVDSGAAFFTIRTRPKIAEFFELFITDYDIVLSPELRKDEILFDLVVPIFFDGDFIHSALVRVLFHAANPAKVKVISIKLDPVMQNVQV